MVKSFSIPTQSSIRLVSELGEPAIKIHGGNAEKCVIFSTGILYFIDKNVSNLDSVVNTYNSTSNLGAGIKTA